MKHTHMALVAVVGYLAFGVAPAHATEQVFYKSILPDGTVSYSDKPLRGTRAEPVVVEPHPADPKAAQEASVDAARRRQALLRSFDARAARAAQLDQQIPAAAAVAEQARDTAWRASTVQEGDRQGRRLTAEYFRRQEMYQSAQAQAERRLDALLQQRAALAP